MRDVVLVTGAGGFIGGHLVSRLRREHHGPIRAIDIKPLNEWYQRFDDVENLQLDLGLVENSETAVAGCQRIFNLAADMGGMGFIEKNKALCMLSVLINTHLLTAARKSGVSRYFYSSSACVYNADKQRTPDVIPLKEEDAYPAMPEDGYGWEKLFSERMCRHFSEDYALPTRVARYHNVYGPLGTWNGGAEKAPAAICRKIIEAKISGKHRIEVWGDGKQTRSFMYIDDCIAGTLKIMNGDYDQPLNLGSSELVTINCLIDIVEKIAGIEVERIYDLSAPKGVNGRNSDNQKIREVFGWEPSTSLRQGMEKTYAWIYNEMKGAFPILAGMGK